VGNGFGAEQASLKIQLRDRLEAYPTLLSGGSRGTSSAPYPDSATPELLLHSLSAKNNLLRLRLNLILIKRLASQIEFVDDDFEKRRGGNGKNGAC
jgi:hypothetical protein